MLIGTVSGDGMTGFLDTVRTKAETIIQVPVQWFGG